MMSEVSNIFILSLYFLPKSSVVLQLSGSLFWADV